MTETTDAAWGVLAAREPDCRIGAAEARAALDRVRGLPALDALAKLKRGPGPTYEPVARVLDAALARAEAAGVHADQLVLVGGSAEPGPELLRESRKLGRGTWFTVPTATVLVELQPSGLRGRPTPPPPARVAAPVAAVPRPYEPADERAAAVRESLYEVLDPDLGVNVVDLGFVRAIALDAAGVATITMTLTSAACPLTGVMEDQIRRRLLDDGDGTVTGVRMEWVWWPAWRPGDVTGEGREQLRAIGFTRF
ncbi:MAG TPA: metal-sulfur cluster assembly factor [Streptosporangiaceae bacterium]